MKGINISIAVALLIIGGYLLYKAVKF